MGWLRVIIPQSPHESTIMDGSNSYWDHFVQKPWMIFTGKYIRQPRIQAMILICSFPWIAGSIRIQEKYMIQFMEYLWQIVLTSCTDNDKVIDISFLLDAHLSPVNFTARYNDGCNIKRNV